MSETALARTAEEDLRLLEKQRVETEKRSLRKAERLAELTTLVASVKLDSARIVDLRKYMFMEDGELDAVRPKLTSQQRRIIRQFEEPKKATAFGVEAAAKLIESETRAQAEKVSIRLNVENAVIQLPEKADETVTPVYIDVAPEGDK